MISFISAGDTWTNRQSSISASGFLPHAAFSSHNQGEGVCTDGVEKVDIL